MTTRIPHTINGEHYGQWVQFPDGRSCYVAHRRSRSKTVGPLLKRMAWCIDLETLRKAEAQGIDAIIVCWFRGRARQLYATRLEDFFGPHSFEHRLEVKQRALPMVRFRVNPGSDRRVITAMMNLR